MTSRERRETVTAMCAMSATEAYTIRPRQRLPAHFSKDARRTYSI